MSRRLTALVIGNAVYEHADALTNPTNDAEDIAAKLAGCGLAVSKAIDCSVLEMGRALKRFNRCPEDSQDSPGIDALRKSWYVSVAAGVCHASRNPLDKPCFKSLSPNQIHLGVCAGVLSKNKKINFNIINYLYKQ